MPPKLPKEIWEPVTSARTMNPKAKALQRMKRDLTEIAKNPIDGILIIPDSRRNYLLHSLIMGPEGTPYEGGFFYFLLEIPETYPFEAPRVKLMNTGQGTVYFNPNLYASGKVCLSIIGTWSGPPWSPVLGLGSLLLSIRSLLCPDPLYSEPGIDKSAENAAMCASYNLYAQHETLRCAVLDVVDPNGPCARDVNLEQDLLQHARRLVLGKRQYRFLLEACDKGLASGTSGQPLRAFARTPESAGAYRWAELKQRLLSVVEALRAQMPPSESSDDSDTDAEEASPSVGGDGAHVSSAVAENLAP